MYKLILLTGTALGLNAAPASACDLDGMFGPHRFNAFANLSGQSMYETDPQPDTPAEAPEPKRSDGSEPADPSTVLPTSATLTDQPDREPTRVPVSEKASIRDAKDGRSDANGPAASANFR